MGLTEEQIATLIIIERSTASISVVSSVLLISSFTFLKSFRTLSNTLIFYASFANLFANVAALIGGSALTQVNDPLCQFQGFLLEMFMQSDPMWSCAMAVNVYLVFFRRYDAIRLKRLYWIYGVICYGVPFVPALFCLLYKTRAKGKMYGNATLWCWIDNDWASIRIYSYYAPIWISILATFIIYTLVGIEIFQKRSELRAAARYNNSKSAYASGTNHTIQDVDLDEMRPQSAAPFSGTRTTEIEVSSDQWAQHDQQPPLQNPEKVYSKSTPHEKRSTHREYSVTISTENGLSSLPSKTSGFKFSDLLPHRPHSMDDIKWAYTRCAMLFAFSILITWVPASVNRVYGLRYPHNPSFALNVGSAIVLPLQGFWNAVIYFMTSMSICRAMWAEFRESRRRRRDRKTSRRMFDGGGVRVDSRSPVGRGGGDDDGEDGGGNMNGGGNGKRASGAYAAAAAAAAAPFRKGQERCVGGGLMGGAGGLSVARDSDSEVELTGRVRVRVRDGERGGMVGF